jgi:hypothetical protein
MSRKAARQMVRCDVGGTLASVRNALANDDLELACAVILGSTFAPRDPDVSSQRKIQGCVLSSTVKMEASHRKRRTNWGLEYDVGSRGRSE